MPCPMAPKTLAIRNMNNALPMPTKSIQSPQPRKAGIIRQKIPLESKTLPVTGRRAKERMEKT